MKNTPLFARTKWVIDPSHSHIGFKVKHLQFANVRGKFTEFDASIHTTGDNFLTAQIDFWLNHASIDTGDINRDLHLKSADFLHTDKFKVIHFTASSYIQAGSDGRYEVYGDLTIKGVSKTITLYVQFSGVIKDTFANEKSIFNAKGVINRKDWGLNWNVGLQSGGGLISEEVWIECDVELTKQP